MRIFEYIIIGFFGLFLAACIGNITKSMFKKGPEYV